MKAKMIAVAVASMLVGCGGGSVEFQSQKGEPEVLVVDEYKGGVNGDSTVQQDNPEYLYQKGESLVQEALPEGGAENGTPLVHRVEAYKVGQRDEGVKASQHGESTVYFQDVYAEATSKGESTAYWQDAYGESQKGESLVGYPDIYAESTDKGDPAFESIEELAICQREGLQDQESCQAALAFINTGMSEAKGEFDKDPATFQIQANGAVATAEGGIKRATKRDATYPEVIEYLVNSVAEDETMASRYTAAGYAIATYYYVRGIPEGHTKTGNPGLCADKGFCGDEYLKYQWN